MTYNELQREVCALGFEGELESEERLLFAARRAMNIIFTERPMYKTLTVSKPRMLPVLKIKCIEHKGGEQDSVSFCARSFSFSSYGSGSYTVTDPSGIRSCDFARDENLHRGYLHGEGKIEFKGDYFYTVYDLAFFDELYGEEINDIPVLDGSFEYRISDYTDDFLACASLPQDENGDVIEGSSVSCGIISVPTGYSGRITLKYKASPTHILGNADEDLILPDGCEHLLPLLVSAYVWLDDDTEKSDYYMMLYRDGMAAVRTFNRDALDNEYTVKDGWA